MSDGTNDLNRRYPAARRRWWPAVAILLATLSLSWLIWAGMHGATGLVTARVDAFEVVSETLIKVTVSVERPDNSKGAQCLLFAQAISYERVGETPVRVAAGGSSLTTVRVDLRTFKRATSAAVEGCRTTE